MTHDVSGSTYKFQKAYPEYFKDLSDKEKKFAEFFVAMMNTTAQECTLAFSGGATTMLNGGREMKGTYSQDGEKLTVKGLPNSPKRARSRKRASILCSAKRGMIRALSTSSLQRSEQIFRNRPFRSAGGLFFCPSRPVDIPAFGDNFFHNVEISVDNSPFPHVSSISAPLSCRRPLTLNIFIHNPPFFHIFPHFLSTRIPHSSLPEKPAQTPLSRPFCALKTPFSSPPPFFHNSTATITTIIIDIYYL